MTEEPKTTLRKLIDKTEGTLHCRANVQLLNVNGDIL